MMLKNEFLRLKFDHKDDDSVSKTIKLYRCIDNILKKKDHIYMGALLDFYLVYQPASLLEKSPTNGG